MAKLKPEQLRERSEHILDAAERCFARAGFHRTTMQDICREAAVSPGALYVYFDSKEALIAGLAERDRAEFAERFDRLSSAPDFMTALAELGRRFFIEDPPHRRMMCVEIGIEATRNAKVGEIQQSVETYIATSFEALFRRLAAEGRIAPRHDIPAVVEGFLTIADGLFYRRAVNPGFAPERVMPVLIEAIENLVRPCVQAGAERQPQNRNEIV